MGSCPLFLLFLGYSPSLPWSLWEARRERGLPQGFRGGSRAAPGWASLGGRVGVVLFIHRVPGKGGPFLFYTINIHHL
ncbi:rCG32493, partial [Rattus norvegicus]